MRAMSFVVFRCTFAAICPMRARRSPRAMRGATSDVFDKNGDAHVQVGVRVLHQRQPLVIGGLPLASPSGTLGTGLGARAGKADAPSGGAR